MSGYRCAVHGVAHDGVCPECPSRGRLRDISADYTTKPKQPSNYTRCGDCGSLIEWEAGAVLAVANTKGWKCPYCQFNNPPGFAALNDVTTKDTNPKDAIGSTKLDMGLVPDTFIAEVALAFTEGALKYGRYNWRVAGVRASIYHAALRRHMAKWWNGENLDPQTGVSHLASAAACIAVLIDGAAVSKLTDDRPPRARNMGLILHDAEGQVKELKRTFAEHNPHQYTIDDGE